MENEEDQFTLDIWERVWPSKGWETREAWLAYCRKWWPKMPAICEALDEAKR